MSAAIGYSSYRDPRLQPPDGDDRWEAIVERLENEYGVGAKLLELAQEEVEDFDLAGELADIYEGHEDDIDAKAIRLIRSLLGRLQDRIEHTARDDAESEIERADEQAKWDRGEDLAWEREDRERYG